MEKLYELHGDPAFDLIVVDTPPTAARARLPRRTAAPHPLARQPRVPHAHGPHAHHAAHHRSRGTDTFADDRPGRGFRGDRGCGLVLPRVRRHGERLPGTRRRSERTACVRRHDLRARDLAPTRRRAGGRVLRRAARRERPRGGPLVVNRIHPSFGVEEPSELERQASVVTASHPNDERAVRLAGALRGLAEFQSIARRDVISSRGWNVGSSRARSRTFPSSRMTSATSPRSTSSVAPPRLIRSTPLRGRR